MLSDILIPLVIVVLDKKGKAGLLLQSGFPFMLIDSFT